MGNKYNKNFLTNVIVRVDFSNPIPVHDKLPSELTKVILESHPISAPSQLMARTVKITPDEHKFEFEGDELYKTEWNYYGKNREKNLVITPEFCYIIYKEHESFEKLNSEYLKIMEKLFDLFPDIQVNRLSLRYVNEIDLNESEPLNWDKYLNKNLSSIFDFAEDKTQIAKGLNNLVFNYGDMILFFNYGMHNPDMPAPIRKKIFVLDYDAQYTNLQDLSDIKSNLKRFHSIILKTFERSITDGLRAIMNVPE